MSASSRVECRFRLRLVVSTFVAVLQVLLLLCESDHPPGEQVEPAHIRTKQTERMEMGTQPLSSETK